VRLRILAHDSLLCSKDVFPQGVQSLLEAIGGIRGEWLRDWTTMDRGKEILGRDKSGEF
jgi:hypothetical protein